MHSKSMSTQSNASLKQLKYAKLKGFKKTESIERKSTLYNVGIRNVYH